MLLRQELYQTYGPIVDHIHTIYAEANPFKREHYYKNVKDFMGNLHYVLFDNGDYNISKLKMESHYFICKICVDRSFDTHEFMKIMNMKEKKYCKDIANRICHEHLFNYTQYLKQCRDNTISNIFHIPQSYPITAQTYYSQMPPPPGPGMYPPPSMPGPGMYPPPSMYPSMIPPPPPHRVHAPTPQPPLQPSMVPISDPRIVITKNPLHNRDDGGGWKDRSIGWFTIPPPPPRDASEPSKENKDHLELNFYNTISSMEKGVVDADVPVVSPILNYAPPPKNRRK